MGAWQDWGSNASFFEVASSGTDDVSSLSNGSKLTLLLVADCLSGGSRPRNPPGLADLTYVFGEKVFS